MPPAERRWSTTTRLTLSSAGVIVACFLLLMVVVMSLTLHYLDSHIDESVDAELAILQDEYAMNGAYGVTRLVQQRLRRTSPYHDRVYRIEDAQGRRLAGNLARWPDHLQGPDAVVLPSLNHPGETQVVAAWARLPDGGRLLVGFDRYEMRHVEQRLYETAGISLLLVLALSWLAGRFLARLSLQPIETIRASAQQIIRGDLRHRVPVSPANDEFDQLARTLNQMLDRIQQLIASVQGATDNIAHDLRSPLTRLRARLEAARATPPDAPAWTDWLDQHLGNLDQVLTTFQALLQIARVDAGLLRAQFTEIDLGHLLAEVADFMEPMADERGQALGLDVPAGGSFRLRGHHDLPLQLLLNLLDNAVKYGAPQAGITLSLRRVGGQLEVALRDHGPGIPAEQRERVFERLYRLDATRQTPGLGLGLSLAKAVVQLHHGSLRLEDAEPGLRVILRLPVA